MKIKVFETFAGIGAQAKALEILKNKIKDFDYKIVATSEWDSYANIAYNAIHNKTNKDNKIKYEDKINYLKNFTHSLNSKTPSSIERLEKNGPDFIGSLYDSFINSNNLGSITEITGEELINKSGHVDLLTYSFPCQDLSTGGFLHGGNKGTKKGSNTRSGLLWEIDRILTELDEMNEKPKYLLLENVSNMLSSKHLNDYLLWLNKLNSLGYSTQTFVIDSSEFGSAQRRKRVYALSVLNVTDEIFSDTLKNKKKNSISRDDVVESNERLENVSKSLHIQQQLKDVLRVNYNDKELFAEAEDALANRTPSRNKMYEHSPMLFTEYKKEKNKKDATLSRTVTTKQDRNPNAGIISILNKDGKPDKHFKNVDFNNKMYYKSSLFNYFSII